MMNKEYTEELTSLMTLEEKEVFMHQGNIVSEEQFKKSCESLNKYTALTVAGHLLNIKKYFSQECFNKPIIKEVNMSDSICLHYDKQTTKCDMRSCTYDKRDPDGFCTCKGLNYTGSEKKQKKHHNYLCGMERII